MRQEKEPTKLNEQAVRAVLQRAYEQAISRCPTTFVVTYYEIINEYRQKGLTFNEIAKAIETIGVYIRPSTLNKLFIREQERRSGVKKAMERIHEPDDDSDF
jgi:hypothetical protein